jgi:hypothetical protein
MAQLEVVLESIVYRNPDPGYRYVMASNPSPVQLSEHEIVCPYNRGQAYYSTDLTLHLARSLDGGATWSEHSLIYDGTRQKYSYHAPMATRLHDGRLLIVGFRTDRSDRDRPLFNEATGGLASVENFLMQSADGGRTWTEPQVLP